MKKLVILGVLVLSLGAVACTESSDPTIVSEANEEITEQQLPGNIQIASNDGVVTLTGTVPDAQTKARAAAIVRDVDGVDRVINNLRTAAGDAPAPAALQPQMLDEDKPAVAPNVNNPNPNMGKTDTELRDDIGSPSHRAGDAPADMRDAKPPMHDDEPLDTQEPPSPR